MDVVDSGYCVANREPDAWYMRETSDPGCGERLAELKDLLSVLDRRWKAAGQYYLIFALVNSRVHADAPCPGEYLRIIEATEFHLASAIR